ncbi:hypothetical protein K443DRAFT_471254 [Laccaria amethystina LaAM-08-1]|uniref:Uncharacterized protein n=1 Tax=Laccaria amethystina LaAM-08-1 TaxID=1095629 RepID=A0A0C9WHT4_9AGAR|nr:hypothetical protein K443DRAFT_471254 [Laccaria amethystina LaAM-08-1]
MTTPTVSTLLLLQSYLVEETVRNLRNGREKSSMVFRMWRLLFEANSGQILKHGSFLCYCLFDNGALLRMLALRLRKNIIAL